MTQSLLLLLYMFLHPLSLSPPAGHEEGTERVKAAHLPQLARLLETQGLGRRLRRLRRGQLSCRATERGGEEGRKGGTRNESGPRGPAPACSALNEMWQRG